MDDIARLNAMVEDRLRADGIAIAIPPDIDPYDEGAVRLALSFAGIAPEGYNDVLDLVRVSMLMRARGA